MKPNVNWSPSILTNQDIENQLIWAKCSTTTQTKNTLMSFLCKANQTIKNIMISEIRETMLHNVLISIMV
jgi:hypothetical protein